MDFKSYLTVECHLSDLSVQAYMSDVKHFLTTFKADCPCEGHIINYLHLLNKNQFTNTSIQRKVSALKMYLLFLKTKKQQPVPDVSNMFKSNVTLNLPKLMSTLTLNQALDYDFLNNKQAARNRLIIGLMYYAGCRVSEVVNMKRSAIFSNHLMIQGKGGKERMVPICDALQSRFKTYLSTVTASSAYLFPSRGGKAISRQLVGSILKELKIGTGITERVTAHGFRHMFATQCLEKGLDLREVQLLLGHSSINTTQIYTHLDKSKLKRTFNHCHPLS
jgi:integrase/recombinase XerD